MPEELALDEVLRDGPAVDGDEGPGPPAALRVDGAGRDLLARPAVALEQHGDVALRGLPEQGQGLPHGGGLAEDRPEPGGPPQLLGQGLDAGPEPAVLAGVPERGDEPGPVQGLLQEVVGPEPHAVDGDADLPLPGEDHHGDLRPRTVELRQEGLPAGVGQVQVEDDRPGGILLEPAARLGPAGGRDGREAGFVEDGPLQAEHLGVVVDEEHPVGHRAPFPPAAIPGRAPPLYRGAVSEWESGFPISGAPSHSAPAGRGAVPERVGEAGSGADSRGTGIAFPLPSRTRGDGEKKP